MSYCRACRPVKGGDSEYPIDPKLKIGNCPWCGRDNRVIEESETDD